MRTLRFFVTVVAAAVSGNALGQALHEGANNFDINGDGSPELVLELLSDCPSGGFLRVSVPGGGVVSHMEGGRTYADALPLGTVVGPGLAYSSPSNLMTCGLEGGAGIWSGRGVDAYFGAQIVLSGSTTYAWFLVRHHTSGAFAVLDFWYGNPIQVGQTPPRCHCADFNRDGDIGTDQDIEDFFRCIAGDCCLTCETADYNLDGDTGTDADIEAFFRTLSSCC